MTSESPLTGLADAPVAAASPGLSLSERLLRRLLTRLTVGRIVVETPAGRRIDWRAPQPGPDAQVTLHRWRALRRLVLHGDLGFAEAYIDGDWSSADLTALIELAARNEAALQATLAGSWLLRLPNRLRHWRRANTRGGSRRNIPAHYDLGNAFYGHWLDPGMTYSSALYSHPEQSLDDAQTAKQDRVIALLQLGHGDRVLEIGCGWGGLAERLGRLGCRVTGLTLSPAQLQHAQVHLARCGLGDRIELRLQDYRDAAGTYDRIVSIEMFEAVGQRYWPAYFAALGDRLAAGGRAVLQVITIAESRFRTYQHDVDFIQRYIFPGGMLPSAAALRREIDKAGLRLLSEETFGASYARTLAEWQRRFQQAWPAIQALGFDRSFKRMWEYYLAYCQAGFEAGAIDVGLYCLGHGRVKPAS